MKLKKIPLLLQVAIAMLLGIIIGSFAPEKLVKLFVTFTDIFGQLLKFAIPLIIIAFIAPGIGALTKGAGKLLALTTSIAYGSTILAGLFAFASAMLLYPTILKGKTIEIFSNPEDALLKGFFTIEIPPMMEVMTALVIAFVLGIGMSTLKTSHLFNVLDEFKIIIEKFLEKIIIPLLPIYILGVFANMTFVGQITWILSIFIKVFIMIIALHILILLFQFIVAGTLSQKNPLSLLKTMLPAYFTALGTQSSASTIPVTLQSTKKLGVRDQIANFVVPLCATIHLSGSTITLTSCATAVYLMQHGMLPTWGLMLKFILLLGVTMIAAPGVPGGGVMATLGILSSVLLFNETMLSLMIALYIAQDSFGTACNVTGDAAIAVVTDSLLGDESSS